MFKELLVYSGVFFALIFQRIYCDKPVNNITTTTNLLNVDLSKFRCDAGNRIIDVFKRGDGHADCNDASDEDSDRTGNHTIVYFVWTDIDANKNFLKGMYVNNSAKGEFQVEIPSCSSGGWKIVYVDRSHVHLRCFENQRFQIFSISRDGGIRKSQNFTLKGGKVDDLLGFLTNSSTGKPVAYFKYKNSTSFPVIKFCSETGNSVSVELCQNLKYDLTREPRNLVFSPKNNGTLFWLEKEKNKAFIVKYSMNTSLASVIGPELRQPNHLTKDAATNRLYLRILADDYKIWVQSFNFNGEQSTKVKEIEDEVENKQFAVHSGIMYWLGTDDKSIFFCNTSRLDCEKSKKRLDIRLNSTVQYQLLDTIYVYDYQTNLEEILHETSSIFDKPSTFIVYAIIGGIVVTLLFVALAYVLGKKKGERTQSMDIHDDILTGTLRRKPAYCNEESLLSKNNDATERIES